MSDEVMTPATAPSDMPSAPHACRGGLTRRAALTGVAAFSGACVLAACGSSTSSDAPAGSEGSDGAGEGSQEGGAGTSVPVADVAVGGGVIVGDAPEPFVVTQPSEGEFKAFSAVCTHQSCTVSSVESDTIVCACHNSRFDAATGEVLGGPATAPLPEMTVSLEGDSLVVSA